MDNINSYTSKFDDFLVFCDPDYKDQININIENSLKFKGHLQGEALMQMMNSLKSQYEYHLEKPENQINLKKFVQIASENLKSIRSSSECILVAGKLNLLLFQYEKMSTKKEFTLPFFTTVEEKAQKLAQDLKGIHSKDELDHYFMTEELKICEPIKLTIKQIEPAQIREYAKNNIFHINESIQLYDPLLIDLITAFSVDQRQAFFQGITEMSDQEQAFRQLFCCISNIHEPTSPLVFESFPENYFTDYFENNLENIKSQKIPHRRGEFLALNGIIIEGRLNPIVEIVILDAIKNNNYLRGNMLLSYMKDRLGFRNNLVCKGLTSEQIAKFQSNSTIKLNFQKQQQPSAYLT